MEAKIRLGVSACMLGQEVRHNGGHKRNRWVTDVLGPFVEFVPVCPEVECGYPTPRPAFRLVGKPEDPRFVISRTGEDHTQRMQAWCARRVAELEKEDLCGFIFQSGSPSSGMERVKVYNEHGMARKNGVGLFARAVMERFPLLPVEEDGRLNDDLLRENFIEQIFTARRWKDCVAKGRRLKDLVQFHAEHKLLVMSHSPTHVTELGRLTAHGKSMRPVELFDRYFATLLAALRVKPTVKRHVNTLSHVQGYFKRQLAPDEKRELCEIIEAYGNGFVPLIVPVTLLNHYVRKYDEPYLRQQVYLHPHPVELKLRNHA